MEPITHHPNHFPTTDHFDRLQKTKAGKSWLDWFLQVKELICSKIGCNRKVHLKLMKGNKSNMR